MFYHPKMMSGLNGDDRGPAQRERAGRAKSVLLERPRDRPAGHCMLVPVDGSPATHRALEHADSLARRGMTQEIHLLNVQPRVLSGDFALDDIVQAERRARSAAAQAILDRAQALLGTGGIACHTAVRFGDVARAILDYANEFGIDEIILGTRGKRTMRDRFRPSVALKVVRLADVPVTVLKPVDRPARAFAGEHSEGLGTLPSGIR